MNNEQLGNFILVGDVGSGKSTLLKALLDLDEAVTKTQALAFHHNNIIDSPGEFISRRVLYGALINTITGVDTIVYLQAADSAQLCMPGDLLRLYADKQVVGVVSKTDLPGADVEAAEALLAQEGIAGPYFRISRSNPSSIQALSDYLHDIERQRVEVGAQSTPLPDRAHGRQL